jgi:hypothetical protein
MQDGSKEGAADILIPVRNRYDHTRTLLEGIYRHSDYPFHIYIFDQWIHGCDRNDFKKRRSHPSKSSL